MEQIQNILGQGKNKWRLQLSPTQILVIGFLTVILIGAILLNLPIASQSGESVGFLNALFTSTSAVCVTGLVVVNTLNHWTTFGHIVIMALIQIGGLGFMTLATTLFIVMGRKITLKERLVIQEALNQEGLAGMVRLSKSIIVGTLIVETVGALFLAIKFIPEFGFGSGIFKSIFHSISAFCNAGFDIIGDSSLTPYEGDIIVNFTIMGLIILGGLGFSVWLDLIKTTKEKNANQSDWKWWFRKLTLHTKLVLVITLVLTVVSFIFFFVAEYSNPGTLGDMSLKDKILGALFQAVTPRTAGFNTIALDQMNDASKFMTIIMMFIGGSPAGTAGGIKTVTMGVILLTIISVIRGKERTEVYRRTIPMEVIQRALAVIMISLGVVVAVTMLLSISESTSFMNVFFEATSAFGTVGLSLGITGDLTDFGKIITIITMFIGRLGPVTIAVALSIRQDKNKAQVKLPEERVMVG